MIAATKIILVGCGKMGSALLEGALDVSSSQNSVVYAIDPIDPGPEIKKLRGVRWLKNAADIDKNFNPEIVVLAVKPQQMAEVLPHYQRFSKAVFLSIAAGIKINFIETRRGDLKSSVVRAMPNLPAAIGLGISAAVANQNVTAHEKTLCDNFLKSVGETLWLTNEGLMDAVTALSGSGPAYFFALCECMAEAGEKLGLDKKSAKILSRETFLGAAALLDAFEGDPEKLREKVTSPGGTTEAALKILMNKSRLPELMIEAMTEAQKRAHELSLSVHEKK